MTSHMTAFTAVFLCLLGFAFFLGQLLTPERVNIEARAAMPVAALPNEAPKPQPVMGAVVKVKLKNSHGSGVHIGKGYFLTAAHVVKRSKDGNVTLKSDRGDVRPAKVLWRNDAYDVALVRTKRFKGIEAREIACRPAVSGETITGTGNPMQFNFVTVRGHVASLHDNERKPPWEAYFMADITIQQGMSGGPVFDARGQILGLMVGMAGNSIGPFAFSHQLAFIAPSSAICDLIPDIRQ